MVEVLGHGHSGDDAELMVEADGAEVAEDVLAALANLLVDGALLLKAVGIGKRNIGRRDIGRGGGIGRRGSGGGS